MQCLRLAISCFAAGTLLPMGFASAQTNIEINSSKPIVLIIALAAGGPLEQEVRLYTNKLNSSSKQQYLIDFKPGAASTIGNSYVARSAPDGHTLLVVTGSFTSAPALMEKLPYDIIKDFAPISLMSEKITVLMSNPNFSPKTFADYIAYARANPGKINFGTTGTGSINHLAGAWLHNEIKADATFIPYKGGAPLLVDLVAGRVDVNAIGLLSALPLIKAGKTRPLAILNNKRSKLLADVPTASEQGLPSYNYQNWTGIVAPGATPPAQVARLNDIFVKVAKAPDVSARLEADGGIPVGGTQSEFKELIVTESGRWKRLAKELGIKAGK